MKKNILILLLFAFIFCFLGCSKISDVSQISIITYKVKFETNGGSGVETMSTKEIKSSPKTYKNNYIFDGWYLDPQFKNFVVFPYKVENDITFYAKWLLSTYTARCVNGEIKFLDSDYSSTLSFNVTPNFDYERLIEIGYRGVKISITYDVRYEKDFNIPFDIGYAGSPKYEVYIMNSDLLGYGEEDLETFINKKTISHQYNISFNNLKDEKYHLTFSTDNVQNVIYFSNITVSFTVLK